MLILAEFQYTTMTMCMLKTLGRLLLSVGLIRSWYR